MKLPVILAFSMFAGVALGQGQNDVKGQQQMKGVGGTFGTTYTLKNGFNFSLISAKYTVDPVDAYAPALATPDDKILVLQFSIKNVLTTDNFLDTTGMFTASDSSNQIYSVSGSPKLESLGNTAPNLSLRPGQGLGQLSLNDPLTMAIAVPGKAKLDKIILNVGRQGKDEDVIRFELKQPPKSGDAAVKNFIASLPTGVGDPTDPWGATLLPNGEGAFGSALSSGYFQMTVQQPTMPTDAVFGGNPPDDGKKYFVVLVNVKSMVSSEISIFEAAGDTKGNELTDEDGEHYQPIGYRKAKADEEPEHSFKKGEEYRYRVFFSVPKDAKLKKLTIGARAGYVWAFKL